MIDFSNYNTKQIEQLFEDNIIQTELIDVLDSNMKKLKNKRSILVYNSDLLSSFLNEINKISDINAQVECDIEFNLILDRYSFQYEDKKAYKNFIIKEISILQNLLIGLTPDNLFLNQEEFNCYVKTYITIEDMVLFKNKNLVLLNNQKYKDLISERISVLKLKLLIEKLNKTLNKHSEKELVRVTFRWLKSDRSLEELYNNVNDLYINPVSFEEFKQIFDHQPIKKNFQLLIWKSTLTTLVYFMRGLIENGFVMAGFDETKNSYKIPHTQIASCFLKKDGKSYFKSSSLKSTLTKFDTKDNSVKYKFFDSLFEDLKKFTQ